MMGRQVEAAQLFYEFSLDRHVPSDHLLRRIDQVLDLSKELGDDEDNEEDDEAE